MHIVAWVCLESHNKGLGKWFKMQCIKEGSTLRVGPKGGKASPRIVFCVGVQDEEILTFLNTREEILNLIKIDKEYVRARVLLG